MERWQGRVALVTGASSGIGAALCESLVKSGMKVVGAARRVDRIQALSDELKSEKGILLPVLCDLTNDEDVYALFDTIKKAFGGVDICINNAGMTVKAGILKGNPDDFRQVIDLNVVALCLCTKLAVASMRERNVDDGHIINLSSITGHRVFPSGGHFYSGTKFAVQAITQAVRMELRQANSNIRVTVVAPGLVKTEIVSKTIGKENEEAFFKKNAHISVEETVSTLNHIIMAPPHVEINDIIIIPTAWAP